VVEVDRFSATLDTKGLSRRLKEYREMAVISQRAAREADLIAGQVADVERLSECRRQVDEVTSELAHQVVALKGQAAQGAEDAALRLSEELLSLREQLHTATAELDQLLERVRGLASTNMKLRRTPYRGVYTSGNRYVVPFSDDLGIEQRPRFESLAEARSLALIRRKQQQQRDFAKQYGAPHDSAPFPGAGGGDGA
jgi:hypothetical protein